MHHDQQPNPPNRSPFWTVAGELRAESAARSPSPALWGTGRAHPGLTEAEAARCAAVRHRHGDEVAAQVAAAYPERWYFAKWLVRTGRLTDAR